MSTQQMRIALNNWNSKIFPMSILMSLPAHIIYTAYKLELAARIEQEVRVCVKLALESKGA